MTDFLMPSLGADMDDGKLVEWLKKPGDTLKRGEVVAVVETQKGAIEIEVFVDGVLEQTVAKLGEILPVGALLAVIRSAGEARPAVAPAPAKQPAPPVLPAVASTAGRPAEAAPTFTGERITPAARSEAKRRKIELGSVTPGPDGVIGLRELAHAKVVPVKGVNFDEMRKAIAAAMARSKREIPHYYVSSLIDLSVMAGWLSEQNARRPVPKRLLPIVPILKACALALTKVPEMNGQYAGGRFVPSTHVKMGIGIAMRGGGLIAPAIEAVDTLPLDDIMAHLMDLSARVRGGRLRSSELMDASVTVSSLGEDSADMLLPVIYPPQVAIIGVGRIAERPWAVDGALAVRMTASFTVAGDHRANDGRSAVRLLKAIETSLQKPEML
jgi:pyruvate dehydrogenase E2 component (dihydrolipoamide acetyltransferase)